MTTLLLRTYTTSRGTISPLVEHDLNLSRTQISRDGDDAVMDDELAPVCCTAVTLAMAEMHFYGAAI
jgi:hypothetical protein